MKPHFRDFNHTFAVCHFIEERSFEFWFRQGLDLRGQPDLIRLITRGSCGAKVVGFGSFDLKPDRCAVIHSNESSLYLMEDRDPSTSETKSGA